MRSDGRTVSQVRNIKIVPNFLINAYSSVLIEWGKTRVICSVSVADEIPQWMKNEKKKGGWLTAEYNMLPSSTGNRSKRERNSVSGRTQEIQRLIGRTLRCACNLEKLDGKTIYVDCDVIDADGGTRCASITGGMIALRMALSKMLKEGRLETDIFIQNIAAVSIGKVNDELFVDLCYVEDSAADVDMNIVMREDHKIVEIQGTSEGEPFSREEMDRMLLLAEGALGNIFKIQNRLFE